MALIVVCVLGLVLHEGRGVAPTQTQTTAPSGSGAGGFASVFIQRWLPAGEGSETDLQPFMSTVPTLTAKPNIRFAAQTPVVLSSDEVKPGYWSVLLAVNEVAKDRAGKLQPAGTHWYRVPVAEAGTSGTKPGSNDTVVWQVTSAPYEVPAPTSAEALTNSVYTDAGVSTSGPIGDTSQRFLDAYLTGQGELARYTSPDTTIAPVTPPSATKVTVSSIAAIPVDGDAQNATVVPRDGTTVHVLVHATVVGSGGTTIPMDYPLTLRSRDGRWEVLSLDPAPSTERRTSEPGRQTPDATDSQPSGSAVPTP